MPNPDGDDDGRRFAGVRVDGEIRRGFPTPSGRLEFYSPTLADWGWPEHAIPTYVKSHVHPDNLEPDQTILISTFRLARSDSHAQRERKVAKRDRAHQSALASHRPRGKADVATGDLRAG